MADLEKHERGDDRPPSAYRRAAPVAPFPEYAPPAGMDRATVAVLLVVGSAVLLGAWLGLHGPGGADPGGVAASSPTGRHGALAGARGPAPGDAGTRDDDLAGSVRPAEDAWRTEDTGRTEDAWRDRRAGDERRVRGDRGTRTEAAEPRIGSGASAPRTGRGAPQVRERHPAGRTRDTRSGHTARPGGGPAHDTTGRGGDDAHRATAPGLGSDAPNPAVQDPGSRAGHAAGRREGAQATRQDRENRPRHPAGRHEPGRTWHGRTGRERTGNVRTGPEAGAGGETPSHRPPGSTGERPPRSAPQAEDRPAPRATSRGPAGPGLLHQWCENNFTTAPLLARACHLYVTP